MSSIKFGTDGWRGITARDFTFQNVALCAQGVASYLKEEGLASRGLVVGYDTRFASEDFASEVAQVMAGNGVKTYLSDKPSPTPVVSYNILVRKAAGAVIITASHNPPQWNGFKYRPEYAGSATPEIIARLEQGIQEAGSTGVESLELSDARSQGLVESIDPMAPYLAQVARLVDLNVVSDAGINVVTDAMYGAGAGYFPGILSGGNSSVVELHGERNPAFPGMTQPEPIARNLGALAEAVVGKGADVGIALDADADRLGVIDEKGNFLTSLQVFALLALYLLEVKGERAPLVKTLTSTSMLFRLGELFQVPVFETPVGFKYVGPVMTREQALMGGEESGGYAFRGHIPERDGVLSGLLFLELMVRTGKRPSELVQYLYDKVGPHYYQRRDVHFQPDEREALEGRLAALRPGSIGDLKVVGVDEVDGKRFRLENGWVVMRFSGTEPLLRIYAEADSPTTVKRILDRGASLLDLG